MNVSMLIKLESEMKEALNESKRVDIMVSHKQELDTKFIELKKNFRKEAIIKLSDFIKFYEENKAELYYNWAFMNRTRTTDNIDEIVISERRKAIRVVYVNNCEGFCEYNVVLVPFDFITDPIKFKKDRAKYVLQQQIKHLSEKIAKDEEKCLEVVKKIESDKMNLRKLIKRAGN